jgi:vitamin B12 transporter
MKSTAIPAALLLLGPTWAPAQTFDQTLDTVIVTATRTARTADETLASVTVITREDIERQQARSVADLLRGTPGLSISNNGGRGQNTSLFLRGANSDQLLVLIDGIKVGSATLGTTAFQDLPLEEIERIEIVRGPRSSLYGSEAIGGVIQIFTRRGGGEPRPRFSLSGGSYRNFEGSAGISGGGDDGWFNASISGVDTRGFDSCRAEAASEFGGCFVDEPDRDGYRNLSGSLRAGYRIDDDLEVEVFGLLARADNEFDGSFQNEAENRQELLGGNLRWSPTGNWDLALRLGRSRDKSDNFLDGVFASRFDSRRDTVSLQNDLALGLDHLLTLGVDYQDDRVESDTAFTVTSRDNTGVFGQYLGYLGDHDIQLALRHDDNEQFGGNSTGSAAWGYQIGDGLRVTLSYGTAFKAPSFNQLYFPDFGNPDLDPEESRSIEAGLRGDHDWGGWSVHVYRTEIDDLIGFDPDAGLPVNVDEALISGLEAAIGTRLAGWDINASLTLLDPENRSAGPNRGNVLPRRAEQSLRLDLDREFGDPSHGLYSLGASVIAESRRYDDLANTRRMGGYATVDLRAEYRIDRDWRLQARIVNLFDKDYETAAFYNQPGRSAYLTVRYEPR